mmetsp:Transcript_15061/g.24475  ORF Transcript_15061/g.24475 Transcript_15061/m.24475 type:complete len:218 (-) Transcript_15061:122-775(-)|eukprot:CAMPEP_0203794860 /NCGR_PEP_ID=MMETSP0100_2-20121128/6816_1 /ASSEMBLY_ACC=CAM_ASM_000210 /TAXON_ID=96639 /ORGANISM=" , Strain NY0313808BC1" /LENGTH=217 /DNA_ID=CAMNT_0050699119 /DNA_START=553 /DNA_END=1206 /DNA_ORIENTATION=+
MTFEDTHSLESPRKRARSDESTSEDDLRGWTSFDIFMQFVVYTKQDGKTYCDASQIVGKACYLTWLGTRTKTSAFPADIFRRTVIAHLTGTKKRKPFPKEVEASLLNTVRVRRVWPCFLDVLDTRGQRVTFGHAGFRPRGYHESMKVPEKLVPCVNHPTIVFPIIEYKATLSIGKEETGSVEKPISPPGPLDTAPLQVSKDEMRMIRFFFDLPRADC